MSREKLIFRLERDDDGYPPVDYESVWMERIGENLGVVDNIPFFCCDVSLGDTVRFEKLGEEFCYVATIQHSGNSLVRVVYYGPDPSVLRSLIEQHGCETELDLSHCLIAVNVPPGRLSSLQLFLAAKESAGELGYEEAILANFDDRA